MGLFSSRSDDLHSAIQSAFNNSGERYPQEAIKKLARQQEAIRRAAAGEEILSIAWGGRDGFLVVTDVRSLVVEGAEERQSNAHRDIYGVKAMNNGATGLVSIITEREQNETGGAWSDKYATMGYLHPLAKRGLIGIKFAVNSSRVADTMRDYIQDQVTTTRWPLPSLFPGYYHEILGRLNKPRTEQNTLALVEYLSQMFSVNAIIWLKNEPGDEQEWWNRFHNSRVPRERWPYLLDDMLAFFWHRDWRYRRAVSEFPVDGRAKVLEPDSPVQRYKGELPFGIWSNA